MLKGRLFFFSPFQADCVTRWSPSDHDDDDTAVVFPVVFCFVVRNDRGGIHSNGGGTLDGVDAFSDLAAGCLCVGTEPVKWEGDFSPVVVV